MATGNGEDLDRLIAVLRRHMPELEEEFKVRLLGVFGSYVRGEQREGSDLDVLVEFRETPTLLDLVGLQHRLGDLLGVEVDLVPRDSLKPRIGERILEEVVIL